MTEDRAVLPPDGGIDKIDKILCSVASRDSCTYSAKPNHLIFSILSLTRAHDRHRRNCGNQREGLPRKCSRVRRSTPLPALSVAAVATARRFLTQGIETLASNCHRRGQHTPAHVCTRLLYCHVLRPHTYQMLSVRKKKGEKEVPQWKLDMLGEQKATAPAPAPTPASAAASSSAGVVPRSVTYPGPCASPFARVCRRSLGAEAVAGGGGASSPRRGAQEPRRGRRARGAAPPS